MGIGEVGRMEIGEIPPKILLVPIKVLSKCAREAASCPQLAESVASNFMTPIEQCLNLPRTEIVRSPIAVTSCNVEGHFAAILVKNGNAIVKRKSGDIVKGEAYYSVFQPCLDSPRADMGTNKTTRSN